MKVYYKVYDKTHPEFDNMFDQEGQILIEVFHDLNCTKMCDFHVASNNSKLQSLGFQDEMEGVMAYYEDRSSEDLLKLLTNSFSEIDEMCADALADMEAEDE